MKHILTKWFRKSYNKITGSIAFYPALIAISFLLLSWLMLELDFSEIGKNIKSNYHLIRLRDATTARTIASTIVTGIISLAVFSFSMVMILLNQAASQLSNRTLENMISNRFQQIVLGFYIGTIVYALFLLSTIRDIDSGIYVPALSIYLLLLLTVGDIFLFIYFLHYITQTVKFETIIKRVHQQTLKTMRRKVDKHNPEQLVLPGVPAQLVRMAASDYYQGFDLKELIRFAKQNAGVVNFLHPEGSYLLKGMPLLEFYSAGKLPEDAVNVLLDTLDFYVGQPAEKNSYFGFHQLTEIALKALSPGINDPQTAVLSLHAITDLFSFLMQNPQQTTYKDNDGELRIKTMEHSFESMLNNSYGVIWDYGKDDQYIQQAMQGMLSQLIACNTGSNGADPVKKILHKVVSR